MRRSVLVGLLLLLAGLRLPAPAPAVVGGAQPVLRIEPALAAVLQRQAAEQPISVIVRLAPVADRAELPLGLALDIDGLRPSKAEHAPTAYRVEAQLRRRAEAAQAPLREWLRPGEAEGRIKNVTAFWIFNGLALTAPRDVILEISRRSDIARIELNRVVLAPPAIRPASDAAPLEPNLMAIGAPEAWARGITGRGMVVALLDSGVDLTHPELAARWRGGSNSWLDPYGEHPETPFDLNGHGTQMLGIMLGGDAGGSHIGVAPDAQWIAAKIFDDRGRATVAGIHQALQWVLDPDGDPATPDAPQVVNNSWSFVNTGCDFEFAEDLRALRAAGILPVFAAGVRDPVSPANLPEALAVGALAEDGERLHPDSARGPSPCGGETTIYPQVVAPGADIRTTDRFGLYTTLDGTSLAAAHVSGALALLLNANPTLGADEQRALLTETAVDLGEPGPDDEFGYGRIDIGAAVDHALNPHGAAPLVLTGVLAAMLIGAAILQLWANLSN